MLLLGNWLLGRRPPAGRTNGRTTGILHMNIISLLVAGLLGLLAVVFAVLLFVAIIFNLRIGIRYRKSLAREFERLRLSRMLDALGLDVTAYLYEERITDIHNQMKRCATCGNTEQCDDQLANGQVDGDTIGYCNNEKSLQSMLKRS